ncbi:MAG: SDR family oxidoreductase [Chloroflexota bacterium]|nr:MAG: SDR family oxidoreductase [Chloroflexota bacterium]
MAGRLEGKVAIITGAGTGIGESHARRFAQEGAAVVLADINLPAVQSIAGDIEKEGGKALAVKLDVSQKAEVEDAVKTTLDAFGKIDILVNNAGVFERIPSVELSEAEWDRDLNINLKGTFLCCQAVGRHMVERRQGKIVNTASVSASRGGPLGAAAYCAAKAGVLGLTRELAMEWARYGINVNAVSPGATITNMMKSHFEESGLDEQEHARKWIPLRRSNRPEDMTNAVLFLASSEAETITGHDIPVDGGISAVFVGRR